MHYGSKQGKIETLNFTLSHERGSERSERASEWVSAAEGASEASSPEQANSFFLLLILGTSSYVALVAQLAAFKFQVTRIFLVISPLSVGRFQKNLDVT